MEKKPTISTISNTSLTTPTTTSFSRRDYMRDYKRKHYKANGDEIRANNKAYYYKNKYNLSSADLKQYGILLPLVSKLKQNLHELDAANPELLQEVITHFFEEKNKKTN